jgi:metacaspase-1
MAKKALLVGLNHYPDPENTLHGCINDVHQVDQLLRTHFGFTDGSAVRLLTDARATTAAIVSRLHWLIDGASAGDVLVFHYSGHGSQVPDRHGDEVDDGLDEIICPYDLDWDDPFTDDDLHEILKGLAPGANLTVILDCCHSGTGLRKLSGDGRSTGNRCLRPPAHLRHPGRQGLVMRRFGARAADCGAILIAGCRSNQVSADAYIDGSYHGALTYYLCRAVEDLAYTGSYLAVVDRTSHLLEEEGYQQVPQLEGPAALLHGPVLAPLREAVASRG